MPIEVRCQCGQAFRAADHFAGKTLKCPACGGPLPIPSVASPSDCSLIAECVCGSRFRAASYLAGKRVACPSCGRAMNVSARASEPVDDFFRLNVPAPTRDSARPTALRVQRYERRAPSVFATAFSWITRINKRAATICLSIGGLGILLLIGALFLPPVVRSVTDSWRDRNLRYGENGITCIDIVDGRGRPILIGLGRMRNGKLVLPQDEPGAVIVAGVKEGIDIGGCHFDYGTILVRTSSGKLIVARPGTIITIPRQQVICGREYQPGTFQVPADSKFPIGEDATRSEDHVSNVKPQLQTEPKLPPAADAKAQAKALPELSFSLGERLTSNWQRDLDELRNVVTQAGESDSKQVLKDMEGRAIAWPITYTKLNDRGYVEFKEAKPAADSSSRLGPKEKYVWAVILAAAGSESQWRAIASGTRVVCCARLQGLSRSLAGAPVTIARVDAAIPLGLGDATAAAEQAYPPTPPARLWTDTIGASQFEARVLARDSDTVHLEKSDGKLIAVAIENLSEADRRYLRRYHGVKSDWVIGNAEVADWDYAEEIKRLAAEIK